MEQREISVLACRRTVSCRLLVALLFDSAQNDFRSDWGSRTVLLECSSEDRMRFFGEQGEREGEEEEEDEKEEDEELKDVIVQKGRFVERGELIAEEEEEIEEENVEED